MKPVRILLSDEAKETYDWLVKESTHSKVEQSILRSFQQKSELIRLNPEYGQSINKRQIPIELKQKYDLKNLFWVGLANYWRMIYSLKSSDNEIEIIAFIVSISDHPKYDRKMHYR